jgi:hypothetical protein
MNSSHIYVGLKRLKREKAYLSGTMQRRGQEGLALWRQLLPLIYTLRLRLSLPLAHPLQSLSLLTSLMQLLLLVFVILERLISLCAWRIPIIVHLILAAVTLYGAKRRLF